MIAVYVTSESNMREKHIHYRSIKLIKEIHFSMQISVENKKRYLVKQIVLKMLIYHIQLYNEWFHNNKYIIFLRRSIKS